MIGGNDIVFPAVGDAAALEACARLVGRQWPDARFEDAVTGDKYDRLGDIPFGVVRELLAYPDAEAEAAWDSDSPDSPVNSILSLIVRPGDVTVVVDDPDTAPMRSLLAAIHDALLPRNSGSTTVDDRPLSDGFLPLRKR